CPPRTRPAPPSSPSAPAPTSASAITTTIEDRRILPPCRPGEGLLSDERTESSATRKELSPRMRMAVEPFGLSESDAESWAFLCECGDAGCQEWITLPVTTYEARQRADQ